MPSAGLRHDGCLAHTGSIVIVGILSIRGLGTMVNFTAVWM
jgi:hypothetical protein